MTGPSTNLLFDDERIGFEMVNNTDEVRIGEDGEEIVDRGTLRITFTGHTLPHWRYEFVEGDRSAIEDLVRRANAVIGLLPPRDPQFRRNRDRVDRDGAREGITVEWVGIDDDE